MTAYYNEIDPGAAAWLRELIKAGHIAHGDVDERSIEDVRPDDLRGYTQCHFFAGIGGWSLALRQAGWDDSRAVWTGSCPCFPAGTLILTRHRGLVPIESVDVGDEVLTHRSRWRVVTATGSEESDLVRVRGQGHWGLETTSDHPFLTGDDEWTNASQLPGKRWRTVARVPESTVPPLENARGVMLDRGAWRATGWKHGKTVYLGRFNTEDEARAMRRSALAAGEIDVRGGDGADPKTIGFARFLGYWVGDGWVSRESVFLCGAKDDGPLLREILEGAGLSCSLSLERTTARARCGSAVVSRWLTKNFGAGAAAKRLPAWLHGAPQAYRDAFLAGYAEADGHEAGDARAWTTVSRALAVGVRILLNQSGKSASITRHRTRASRIEGRHVSEGEFYRVTAYERARSFTFNKEHGVGLVRTVEPAGHSRVFNLAVADDESYTADGIAVHNCQPFSSAGKGAGFADERHLWPAFFHLIEQCRPTVVFGEQVASSDGRAWLDLVFSDLEGAGYATGAANLSACGIGAPHIRQRLYWVADAVVDGREQGGRHIARRVDAHGERPAVVLRDGRADVWVADSNDAGKGLVGNSSASMAIWPPDDTPSGLGRGGAVGRLADADQLAGEQGRALNGRRDSRGDARARSGSVGDVLLGDTGPLHGFWRDADWLGCRDGKWRPVEPGTFPLAHGIPARVGRLRGYGNAIVPQVAETFIRAYAGCGPLLTEDLY